MWIDAPFGVKDEMELVPGIAKVLASSRCDDFRFETMSDSETANHGI